MSMDLETRIQIAVDNVAASESLGQFRESMKNLKSLALEVGDTNSEQFQKVSKAMGDAIGRSNDLNDAFKAMDGEPIERVAKSFKGLISSLAVGDIQQAKVMFNGLKTSVVDLGAASTVALGGLGLLIAAIGLLVKYWDNIIDQKGPLGDFFRGLQKSFQEIKQAAIDFTEKALLKIINAFIDLKDVAKNSYEYLKFGFKTVVDYFKTGAGIIISLWQTIGGAILDVLSFKNPKETIKKGIADIEGKMKDFANNTIKSFEDIKVKSSKHLTDLWSGSIKEQKEKDKKAAEARKKAAELAAKAAEEEYKRLSALLDQYAKEEEKKGKESIDRLFKNAEEKRRIQDQLDKIEKDRLKNKYDELLKEDESYLNDLRNIYKLDELYSKDKDKLKAENEERLLQESLDANERQQMELFELFKSGAITKEEYEKRNTELLQQEADIRYKIEENNANKIKKLEEEKKKNLEDSIKYINDIIKGSDISYLGQILSLVKNIGDASVTTGQKIQQSLGTAINIAGSIGSILADGSKEQIDNIQDETNLILNSLEIQKNAGILNEEEYQSRKNAIQVDAQKRELEVKKKAFDQDKAIRIAQAVMSTAQAVISGLAAPFPMNIVMPAIAAAVGAAQIAVISSQSFNSRSGVSPGGGISAPSGGAQPQPSSFFGLGQKNLNEGGGKMGDQRVYVVESDISSTQGRMAKIRERATLGG